MRVAQATRDTYTWVTRHTKTYNEHWRKEGRPSAEEHFPKYEYFRALFDAFDLRDIIWIEKSRDMMVTWACVGYLTLRAMKTSYYGVVFQTQKDDKVIQLVDYAKHLWRNSDPEIQQAYPLSKPLDLTGEICTKWNERESTWRKSGSCQSRDTSQSRS